MTKYYFTEDAGHGWLHVKRAELERLGILNQITPYSHQRGKTVYLEEDVDAQTFLRAKEARGEPVTIVSRYCDRSSIRSYAQFSP